MSPAALRTVGEPGWRVYGVVEADYFQDRWFAQPDDIVGGWCLMNVDKRPSQARHRAGEWQIADFLSENAARHVAELHNRWLEEQESA